MTPLTPAPAPQPVQNQTPTQAPNSAPSNGLPANSDILSMVAKKLGQGANSAIQAIAQPVAGLVDAAVGNAPTVMSKVPAPIKSPGQTFAAKFKNVPASVMAIEPAVSRASKAYDVPPDAMAYTLMSENAPADTNPKGVDPNDQGMFQVNKLNSPLVETALKRDFGITYDPSNPNHSAMAAAVVLSDTQKQLQAKGFSNLSPQDLSIAYRMGATNYSLATRGTDLNGNKGTPSSVSLARGEYKARMEDLNNNTQALSTDTPR